MHVFEKLNASKMYIKVKNLCVSDPSITLSLYEPEEN